jgi:hypothetical protein
MLFILLFFSPMIDLSGTEELMASNEIEHVCGFFQAGREKRMGSKGWGFSCEF